MAQGDAAVIPAIVAAFQFDLPEMPWRILSVRVAYPDVPYLGNHTHSIKLSFTKRIERTNAQTYQWPFGTTPCADCLRRAREGLQVPTVEAQCRAGRTAGRDGLSTETVLGRSGSGYPLL